MGKLTLTTLLFLACLAAGGQEALKQTVKGIITDADSKMPLAGATVSIGEQSTITDSTGEFQLANVAIGRSQLSVSMVGYDSKKTEVIVNSGKEVYLAIPLVENIRQMDAIKIVARRNRSKPLNEFASASARSFSVEETKRYPAAVYDPARMAMNYAGVANNGDGNNDIVVRGNSPKGVLWRLEGIEIPNPNHFGALGNSGGPISMLSSSTLGASDFYTGAFPAEFGAALSGAFDINFRTGNKDKREYAFMIGGMGIEAAAEGPFKKGSAASYLVNYRYSTLALLSGFLDIGGVLPEYQDLSFKLNVPTKRAGTFTLFGLGGLNTASKDPAKDSTKWNDDDPNFVLNGKGRMGVAGLVHQYFINERSYIRTTLSPSVNGYREIVDSLNPSSHYDLVSLSRTDNQDLNFRASVVYNNKINANHTVRAGVLENHMRYRYSLRYFDEADDTWRETLSGKGSANYYQAFAMWKYRVNALVTVNTGVHASHFDLNGTGTIEPRMSVTLQPGKNQVVTLAAGIHAKPEHLSTYLYVPNGTPAGTYPNRELEIPKAAHIVLSYEKGFRNGFRLKAESYYQHLYDVPVEEKQDSYFSMLNAAAIYDLLDIGTLASEGTGTNYGIDITLEKPFSRNYYALVTGSVYRSRYTNFSGNEFNTRFNREYQVNLISGREWKTGRLGKNIIGLNGKVLASGGMKESPIDLEASRTRGKVQYVTNEYYSVAGDIYARFDVGFSYKINKRHSTHIISLDIQNITNRKNLYFSWYDNDNETVKKVYQLGFFPIFNYRIEF
ncbi:MAG TPA: TonB-dependent receptor [Flavisolibacter sp.]